MAHQHIYCQQYTFSWQAEAVGPSVAHPMTEEHYIQWICLVTSKGIQRVNLSSTDKPEAVFYIGEEKPVAVYEYCNLHGLWKKEL